MHVWGSSTIDVYVVGVQYNSGHNSPLLYHYDGSDWTNSIAVLPSGSVYGNLAAAWGSSASNVYEVGGYETSTVGGALLNYYDGSSWTASTPVLPTGWAAGNLSDVWGSGAGDVYAVGWSDNGTTQLPVIFHYASSPSANANLSNLALSTGALTPVFDSGTTTYTQSVANAVASL